MDFRLSCAAGFKTAVRTLSAFSNPFLAIPATCLAAFQSGCVLGGFPRAHLHTSWLCVTSAALQLGTVSS